MLYWMVSKTNSPLTEKQLIHAIRRNFDGLDKFDAAKILLSDTKHLATQTKSKDRKVQFFITKLHNKIQPAIYLAIHSYGTVQQKLDDHMGLQGKNVWVNLQTGMGKA